MNYAVHFFIFIFFIISCSKPITDTHDAQVFINDCTSQGEHSRLKEFCECCYIESQKFKTKGFIDSHIKMLGNQEIGYKDAIEENCMNLLY